MLTFFGCRGDVNPPWEMDGPRRFAQRQVVDEYGVVRHSAPDMFPEPRLPTLFPVPPAARRQGAAGGGAGRELDVLSMEGDRETEEVLRTYRGGERVSPRRASRCVFGSFAYSAAKVMRLSCVHHLSPLRLSCIHHLSPLRLLCELGRVCASVFCAPTPPHGYQRFETMHPKAR
jgi:hypothetical protein